MEITELSLAPKHLVIEKSNNNSSSESESYPSRKRKFSFDHLHSHLQRNSSGPVQASVDLHVKDPLPLDWEQCLDLEAAKMILVLLSQSQSGRMYYLNRNTSRKSWNLPKEQKLDLELNISSTLLTTSEYPLDKEGSDYRKSTTSSPSNNMVALACLNCHLLVILSKSSPSCPNCKFVHSLPALQSSQPKVISPPPKLPLNTLSLLN